MSKALFYKNFFLIFCFISFFFSCSSVENKNFTEKQIDSEGISALYDENKNKEQISHVRIDEFKTTEDVSRESNHHSSKIALLLGPGLYRTFFYVGILRSFEKNNLSVDLISGSEMSSLVAALYAKYGSSSILEWKLFHLLKKLDAANTEVFSNKWFSVIETFIENEFSNTKFSNLKKKLVLGFYHIEKKKIISDQSYSIEYYLRNSLSLSKGQGKNKTLPLVFFRSYLQDDVFNEKTYNIIALDVLGEKVVFKTANVSFVNLYEKIKNRKDIEKNNFYYFYTYNLDTFPLDSSTLVQEMMAKGELEGEKLVIEIRKKIGST